MATWTLAPGQLPGKVTGWALALFSLAPQLSPPPHTQIPELRRCGWVWSSQGGPWRASGLERSFLIACLLPFSLLGNSETLLLFLPMTLSLFGGWSLTLGLGEGTQTDE